MTCTRPPNWTIEGLQRQQPLKATAARPGLVAALGQQVQRRTDDTDHGDRSEKRAGDHVLRGPGLSDAGPRRSEGSITVLPAHPRWTFPRANRTGTRSIST